MTDIPVFDEKSREGVIDFIRALLIVEGGTPWIVTVKKKTKKRSLSQNALYHKWIDDARKEEALSGWDHDDLDDALKERCDCPRHVYTGFDGTEKSRRSTSNANSREMADYMDRVYRFLVGEYGIYLTLPEDQGAA